MACEHNHFTPQQSLKCSTVHLHRQIKPNKPEENNHLKFTFSVSGPHKCPTLVWSVEIPTRLTVTIQLGDIALHQCWSDFIKAVFPRVLCCCMTTTQWNASSICRHSLSFSGFAGRKQKTTQSTNAYLSIAAGSRDTAPPGGSLNKFPSTVTLWGTPLPLSIIMKRRKSTFFFVQKSFYVQRTRLFSWLKLKNNTRSHLLQLPQLRREQINCTLPSLQREIMCNIVTERKIGARLISSLINKHSEQIKFKLMPAGATETVLSCRGGFTKWLWDCNFVCCSFVCLQINIKSQHRTERSGEWRRWVRNMLR